MTHGLSPPPPAPAPPPTDWMASYMPAAILWGTIGAVTLIFVRIVSIRQARSRRQLAAAEQYAQQRSEELRAWLRSAIDNTLPMSRYTHAAFHTEDEDCNICLIRHTKDWEHASECPFCLEPFVEGDLLRLLPCRHFYHPSCVDEWLSRPDIPDSERACPLCKRAVALSFDGGGQQKSATSTSTTAPLPPAAPDVELAALAHSHDESAAYSRHAPQHEHTHAHAHEHAHEEHTHEHEHADMEDIEAPPAQQHEQRHEQTHEQEQRFRASLWNGSWVVAPRSPPDPLPHHQVRARSDGARAPPPFTPAAWSDYESGLFLLSRGEWRMVSGSASDSPTARRRAHELNA